ncbi:MAG: PIN domain-containing protein [Deltaproteobacteria bacterium]|nr:PIN domain-containing protein [Deltaproteobacteria bacterium]
MSGDRYVLDTSAILTLIEDEPGADRVEQALAEEEVFIPWVVLLEAVYITRQERGEAEAERRYALLKQLRAAILWEADEPTVLTAARFKASHRVSLADAVIAAFAARQGAVLLHKDPEYEPLAPAVRQERLPNKA